MKTALRIVAAGVVMLGAVAIHSHRAGAQAMVGRDIGTNRVSVDYYKAPPGRQDEWLALYKKYHRPIMDFQIQKGVTISSTLYATKSHSPGMPWDFVIISISPPEGQGPKLNMTRAEVIRKLFPDIEDYVKGERQRWALTVNHWDEDLVEIDVTRDPLSVYYPLDAPAKKNCRDGERDLRAGKSRSPAGDSANSRTNLPSDPGLAGDVITFSDDDASPN